MTGATTHLALELEAVPRSVRDARNAVADVVSAASWPARAVDDVRLCVSEAVANVVRHAYESGGALRLVVERRGDELVVAVRDSGLGLAHGVRDGRDGGCGLRIIERLTERVELTSEAGAGTAIVMVFSVPHDGSRESSG